MLALPYRNPVNPAWPEQSIRLLAGLFVVGRFLRLLLLGR